MAHELSHILHYHFRLDVVGDAVEAVKVGTELSYAALLLLGEATGKQTKMASVVEKVEGFYKRVEVVQFLEESALTPAFTREQEAEADLLAFDLMVKAGYNPDASLTISWIFCARTRKHRKHFAMKRNPGRRNPRGSQGDVFRDIWPKVSRRPSLRDWRA